MNRLLKSFFGLTLGVAFSLGVAASLNANKKDVVKQAEALDSVSFYVAYSGSYTVKYNANVGWNQWRNGNMTKLAGTTHKGVQVYSGSFAKADENPNDGGLDELQIQLYEGNTWRGQQRPYTSWTDFSAFNGKIFIYETNSWETYSVDRYQIKCGSGSYVSMIYDEGAGLPSGLKGQYSATLNITAGQSLTVQKNTTGSWTTISPSYAGDGNNYWEGTVYKTVSGAKIYLKLNSDDTFNVWVPGYSACTVFVGGEEYITTQSGEGSSAVYDTTVIFTDKTQSVQVCWNHNIESGTYLNKDSVAGCFDGHNDDGTVTCNLTGAYIIRVHNNGYGKHNTVYITRNDNSTATYLAQKFNSLVGGTCHSDGSTRTSDLKTAWDNAAGHFTGQPTDITNKFVKNSSDSDIRIMMGTTGVDGKYQYVIHKYGTGVASDFLGTGDTKQAHSFMPLAIINNDNSVIIIVAISALGLLSVGAYFFFKKSKKAEE